MRDWFVDVIDKEADKLIKRYHEYHNSLHMRYKRSQRRLVSLPRKMIKIPAYWDDDPKYNPFYVKKHRKSIAFAIQRKLDNGAYSPHEPVNIKIPKNSGGFRTVTVYQIPDAAISTYIYRRLMAKNKHRFSSFAYAYRDDRNVHHAIQDIAIGFKGHSRLFVCECDFSDFFGSIDHDYLKEQLDKNGFAISAYDRKVIDAFINAKGGGKGIPQGTSISLFLANLACWQLDRNLEAEGLRFARYADDTLIWSSDYNKINRALQLIHGFSHEAKIPINKEKSPAIRLLVEPGMPSEFPVDKTTEYVEFLGYKISLDKIGIKSKSIEKIKAHIRYILYRNLIQPLRGTQLNAVTIPRDSEDKDFVAAVSQMRRYLYGGLTEHKLRGYLNGKFQTISFKGIMSFYPLVNDEEQLLELDKWLVATIIKTIRLRKRLFAAHGYDVGGQFPFDLKPSDIVARCRIQEYKGLKGITALPSFLRIHKAISYGIIRHGVDRVVGKGNAYR